MFIKICGITTLEDAELCVSLGADAIGLVFAESTRQVDQITASEIQASVGEQVKVVGVFDETNSLDQIKMLAERCQLDIIQLHDSTPKQATELESAGPVLRAFKFDSPELHDLPPDNPPVLIDSSTPGSGKVFDWSILEPIATRYILAGGLNVDNIYSAVSMLQPYGVDVSSGVSSGVRDKDPVKLAEFIRLARLGSALE